MICPRCKHKMFNVGCDEDLNNIFQCSYCNNVEVKINIDETEDKL